MDINVTSIVTAYEAGTSMREIAAAHHISKQLVRRILIDAGAYANTTTVYALSRLDAGASLDEIAAELGITRNAVISNLPHTKGVYGQSNPTANAARIRAFRARKKEEKIP